MATKLLITPSELEIYPLIFEPVNNIQLTRKIEAARLRDGDERSVYRTHTGNVLIRMLKRGWIEIVKTKKGCGGTSYYYKALPKYTEIVNEYMGRLTSPSMKLLSIKWA